jgi:hypothetical protein
MMASMAVIIAGCGMGEIGQPTDVQPLFHHKWAGSHHHIHSCDAR